MKRSLSLKKETLTPLATDELSAVNGAASGTCYTCVECAVNKVTQMFDYSVGHPTECCQGIPTFHRAAC